MTSQGQHLLSAFYLRGFAERNLIWIFDRKVRRYDPRNPITACREFNYYTFQKDDGTTTNQVEAMFSLLETKAKPIIRSLERKERITLQNKFDLSWFIAGLAVRTKYFERALTEVFDPALKIFLKRTLSPEKIKELNSKAPESISNELKSNYFFDSLDRVIVKPNKEGRIGLMIDTMFRISKHFFEMPWAIAYAMADSTFIASDNPITIWHPDGHNSDSRPLGVGSPEALKIIPLTKSTSVNIGNIPPGYYTAPHENVKRINLEVAKGSEKWVVSSSRKLLEALVIESGLDVLSEEKIMEVTEYPDAYSRTSRIEVKRTVKK